MESDTQLDGQEVHSISYDQFSEHLDKICCEERKIPISAGLIQDNNSKE